MNKSAYARLRPLTPAEIEERLTRLDNDAQNEEGLADKASEKKKQHGDSADGLIAQLRKLVRDQGTGKPVFLLLDETTTNERPDGQEELAFDDDAGPQSGKPPIDAELAKGPRALPAGGAVSTDNLAVYKAKRSGSEYAVAQEQSGGPWALLIDGARDTREFQGSSEAMAAGEQAARGPLKWKAYDRTGKPWRPGRGTEPKAKKGAKPKAAAPAKPKAAAPAKPKGNGAPKRGAAGKATRKPKALPPGAPGAAGAGEGGTPPPPSDGPKDPPEGT